MAKKGKAKSAKGKPVAAAAASSQGGVFGAVQFVQKLKEKRSAHHGTTEVRKALLMCVRWRACLPARPPARPPAGRLVWARGLSVIARCVASPAASSFVCVGGAQAESEALRAGVHAALWSFVWAGTVFKWRVCRACGSRAEG